MRRRDASNVRRWVLVCAVIPCIGVAGCSRSGPAAPDHARFDAEADPGQEVSAEVNGSGIVEVGEDTLLVCIPDETACAGGVRRRCSKDGEWMPDPCPAGEVCEGGVCTPNLAFIYIVVDNIAPTHDAGSVTDPALVESANVDSCALNADCCSDLNQTGLSSSLGTERLAKYWVRRLVGDLRSERVRFALLHPPAIESGDPRNPCALTAPLSTPASCGGQFYQIYDEGTATDAMGNALGVDYSKGSTAWRSPWYPAKLPTEGQTLDAARSFLRGVVAAGPAADADEVLRWVDEVEETRATTVGCGSDPDCPDGFCRAGTCWRHTNPELPFWPVDGFRPLPWLAYVAMGIAGTAENVGCSTDADCRIPGFKCLADGRCHDEARYCRRRHVVLLSTFLPPVPDWAQGWCDWRQDVDPSLWTHWLRWGCGCRGDSGCATGATCIESGSCKPEEGSPDYDCWKFNECMPVELQAVLAAGPPYEPYGDLYAAFHAVCTAFPTMAPLDRNGDVIRAKVHTIVTYQPDILHAADGLASAAGAAIIGDGVFVTPCRPGSSGAWTGGVRPCDYESQYQALLESIKGDLHGFVCDHE